MTATDLGLGGQPVKFLGALVRGVNTTLGLEGSASTCSLTLVEDLNPVSTPGHSVSPAIFQPPEMGSFQTITIGEFTFSGVVTGYNEDVANISGRQITVSLSDPREIMTSIPVITGPGYQAVSAEIKKTSCSLIDAFGAYDFSFADLGFEGSSNIADWNESGMTYADIALAFQGGSVTRFDKNHKVTAQLGEAFGETYFFDLSEVTARVDPDYRVNTNLGTITDLIQEVSSRHSFDWYIESERNLQSNRIDVKIKIIDRSIDNVDLDLDNFLIANSGFIQSANRGFELRNELSCPVLMGAPIEQLVERNILGLANNPVDLSAEGHAKRYSMVEEEMRYVLSGLNHWKQWVAANGGPARYNREITDISITSQILEARATDLEIPPILDLDKETHWGHPLTMSRERLNGLLDDVNEAKWTQAVKVFKKLEGHASATYGKRFMFTPVFDSESIDAAWTGDDVIGGNDDPNEYFRNAEGKTRCYVEFTPVLLQIGETNNFPPNFTALTQGDNGPQKLQLELRDSFHVKDAIASADKSDWIIQGDPDVLGGIFQINPAKLYVAATIEDTVSADGGGVSNVCRIDSPILQVNSLGSRLTPDEKFGVGVGEDEDLKYAYSDAARGGHKRLFAFATEPSVAVSGILRSTARGNLSQGERPTIHRKAFQPARVFVPTKSKLARYGPVFSSKQGEHSEGKLVIDQDDGFAPWIFGGQVNMINAMQLKVDNAASDVKTVEKASITIEGVPKLNIGASIGKNSNINSISITFGSGGVSTTYELRSFLRKFGELSKQELAFLSLIARRAGGKILPQDTISFINKFRPILTKQFSGTGSSTSDLAGSNIFE